MKRFFFLMLLMILSVLCLSALADGAVLPESDMPQAIREYFSASNFSGYTIRDTLLAQEMHNGSDYYFAVTQKDGHNVLHGFRRDGGSWRHFLRTDSAIPQGRGMFLLTRGEGTLFLLSDQTLQLSGALCIQFTREDNEEQPESYQVFDLDSAGRWNLKLLCCHYSWREVLVGKDSLTYYYEGEKEGSAKGTVQTDLRYFSYAAFPKSVSEARSKLSSPPELPASGQLSARAISFTGGKKYPVYTGPGTQFQRAANGKAAVSTNDWIQVFGYEEDWIMIQYDITSDHLRIGYIEKSALPKNADVGPLNLGDLNVTVNGTTYLTDDPLKSRSVLCRYEAGKTLTWLADLGDWYYVQDEENKIRGFVLQSDVDADDVQGRDFADYFNNGIYAATADVTLHGDRTADITVMVIAPADWLTDGDRIDRYRVYGNNTRLSVSDLETTCAPLSGGRSRFAYTMQVTVPENVNVLGLCPEYADGVRAGEAVTVFVR